MFVSLGLCSKPHGWFTPSNNKGAYKISQLASTDLAASPWALGRCRHQREEEKVWRTPFTTSLARAGCAVVTVGHEIHLLGGFDSNRQEPSRGLGVTRRLGGGIWHNLGWHMSIILV